MCTNIFASCPISIAGELTNSALSLPFSFGDSFSRSFNFLEKHIDLCVVRLPMDKPFDLAHEQFYCLSHFETKLKWLHITNVYTATDVERERLA